MADRLREPIYVAAVVLGLGALWAVAYSQNVKSKETNYLPPAIPTCIAYDPSTER